MKLTESTKCTIPSCRRVAIFIILDVAAVVGKETLPSQKESIEKGKGRFFRLFDERFQDSKRGFGQREVVEDHGAGSFVVDGDQGCDVG